MAQIARLNHSNLDVEIGRSLNLMVVRDFWLQLLDDVDLGFGLAVASPLWSRGGACRILVVSVVFTVNFTVNR